MPFPSFIHEGDAEQHQNGREHENVYFFRMDGLGRFRLC